MLWLLFRRWRDHRSNSPHGCLPTCLYHRHWPDGLSLSLSFSLSNDLVFNRILERRQLLRQPKSSPRPHNNNSIQHSHYLNDALERYVACCCCFCFFLPRQIRAKWNYIVLYYKVCLLSCLLFAFRPLPSRIYQIIEPRKMSEKKRRVKFPLSV